VRAAHSGPFQEKLRSGLSFFLALVFRSTWAATNSDPNAIPPLRPPRPEIPPGVWELYGTWIVIGSIVAVALVGGVIWWLIRPRPAPPIAPAVEARAALQPLSQEPETGVVLSRVSQIVRHYFAGAFGLPAGELTTSEFCQAIGNAERIGTELSREVSGFLRECDERKFALSPPLPPLGAVYRAETFIEEAEKRRTPDAEKTAV